MELGQLWRQFKADARASYRFYQRDVDAREPGQRGSFFHRVQEFSWAILEKLTPARRVLLLLGMVLLLLPSTSFTYQNKAGGVQIGQFDLRFYGGVLLFLLLMLEVADRVTMKRDLEIARDIQQWLVPANPPDVPGLKIAFAARPANTVAGDFYDVFARQDNPQAASSQTPKFLIAVADVAGKSIPAALLMATFQASLKTLSAIPCPLSDLTQGMNRYACSNSQDGRRFTTAFLSEFDPSARALTYVNAGHNAPIVQRESGAVEHLSEGGLPLGILIDGQYPSATITLQPGDWLVIFTDGLVEAVNATDEEFGEPRLLAILRTNSHLGPQDLLKRVMAELETFVGATAQHDDITCVVIKAQ